MANTNYQFNIGDEVTTTTSTTVAQFSHVSEPCSEQSHPNVSGFVAVLHWDATPTR